MLICTRKLQLELLKSRLIYYSNPSHVVDNYTLYLHKTGTNFGIFLANWSVTEFCTLFKQGGHCLLPKIKLLAFSLDDYTSNTVITMKCQFMFNFENCQQILTVFTWECLS
jgi:hypothetical protein